MIISVNSQILASQLRLLNKVVPNKPVLQALSHAKLQAEEGKLHLYATDLEVGLKVGCPATVEKAGTMLVPVSKLLALVERFPDADVQLALQGDHVSIKCGNFKSKLLTMSAEDFPAQPPMAGSEHDMAGEVLKQGIARTRYAVSATASKHVLQGALLTVAEGQAAMVSTDGKRLALSMAPATGTDLRVVLPLKVLDMVSSHADGPVIVTVGDSHLFFVMGDVLLLSRMLDGAFPAYERIIPRKNEIKMTIDRAALAAALRRIVVLADNNVATYFKLAPSLLSLTSASAEVGSADEELPMEFSGAEMTICVNGEYVLDFLEACTGASITCSLKDESSAMLLEEGDDHVAVIMPMRGR